MREYEPKTCRPAGHRLIGWLRTFKACERAAVTVEWVALAGGLVIGSIAITYLIMGSLGAPALTISKQLTPPSS